MITKTILISTILLPFLQAILLPLFKNKSSLRDTVSLSTAFINLALSIYLTYDFFTKKSTVVINFITIQSNFSFSLYTENMSILFNLLVNILWCISIIYSIGYIKANRENHQTRFYAFFASSIGCTIGVAFSYNLFTLFLFYELLTLVTIPLVAHNINKNNKRNVYIYIGVLVITSLALFLVAIISTYYLTGQTTFTQGGIYNNIAPHTVSPQIIIVILLMFIFGIAKTAIMPVHRWLPAAMIAPTPVSALLHAVAVVKSGAFAFVKVIVFIFGVEYLNNLIHNVFSWNWLVIIPAATTLIASIIAAFQDNLKRRLAYSTVAQLAYVTLGALVLTPSSILAANLQIFAHAFGKITLFFAAGSIISLSRKHNVSELNGLGHKMPLTFIAFTIGALSIIGFPLTIGFTSKWFLIMGIIESGQIWLLIVIILSTVLNAIYLFPIIIRAFFAKTKGKQVKKFNSSKAMDIAMLITSALVIVAGIYSNIIINLILKI